MNKFSCDSLRQEGEGSEVERISPKLYMLPELQEERKDPLLVSSAYSAPSASPTIGPRSKTHRFFKALSPHGRRSFVPISWLTDKLNKKGIPWVPRRIVNGWRHKGTSALVGRLLAGLLIAWVIGKKAGGKTDELRLAS
jgi:hypothetical protein